MIHSFDSAHEDSFEFHVAVCECGYTTIPVPVFDLLFDEMMEHAANEARKERAAQYEGQIDRLADFIINEIPGEPSESQGAVDTAIRLLTDAYLTPRSDYKGADHE